MKFKIFLTLFAIIFFTACSSEEKIVKHESFQTGEKIELTSVMGSKITLVRTKNGFSIDGDEKKILMIDIFGTFCQPCKEEAAYLMDFQLQNADDLTLVALSHFEEVSNEYIVENFSSKYNAYYFIVNDPRNKQIVETILSDINYKMSLQVPFKVILKDGKYEILKDIYENKPDNRYYIGKVPIHVIQEDIDKMKKR
jgi:thiol-disulfide isomerase/thioredoxin